MNNSRFSPVSAQVNFPKLEEEILSYWKQNKIFEKSVSSRPADKKWTFLDGPPFITGMPHYGSLLSSIPKDVFPRFWTMKGYRVRRVWGWDCHGLPAENKVEVSLGLKSKREIEEKVGVKKFIDLCKEYVSKVSSEWEWYIDHIGRWVDFRNAYKTMDLPYMETVMWVFKQMYDKGYIYKGLRVSLYCPHCATPISNFEVAMDEENYKDSPDPATTYKYKIIGEKDTYVLAWSTTPWNKIVTPALAVNPKLSYVKVEQKGQRYILAESTLKMLSQDRYKIVDKFKGEKLVGRKYEPHYDYYKNKIIAGKKAFIIIGTDFVTADEGTGIVTIAAYGLEDLAAMQKHNIHIEMHLDDEGTIQKDVPIFGGLYYLKANKLVDEDLGKRGLIYQKNDNYSHRVPLCWRCHTKLYYSPQDAWYVDIQKLKPLLFKTNKQVHWFPEHFKFGRFQKSVEFAPDWNISRSRYWGSPVPVWECKCGERFVPGSIKELEEAAGQKILDLHKPEIDEVSITCKKCAQKVHRVPEVLDSWIEAGSASFAERHFPFDKPAGGDKLEDFFPPDFIAEYTGQIRAWFYVLHVIGAALFQSPSFKNVLVEGVILGTDARKMSKNYGNYPDPKELLQKYGGDALRLYLLGSPVMHGEDILISESDYRDQVRGMMLILWNVYNFFITYANIDHIQTPNSKDQSANVLDEWIISRLHELIKVISESFESYDTVKAVALLHFFIDELSTWYIRRSRDRVGLTAIDESDQKAFYATCYEALTTLCQMSAPLMPFLSEAIYKNLTGESSVHLSNWPKYNKSLIKLPLNLAMKNARLIVELGHAQRKKEKIKVRQPLANIKIEGPGQIDERMWDLIEKELNVKNHEAIVYAKDWKVNLDFNITDDLKKEGEARELMREIQMKRKELGCSLTEKVEVTLPHWPAEFTESIKRQTLASKLIKGDALSVKRS